MGHNIDLSMFGMVLRCQRCKEDLDLSEVDIDCDLSTHHPMEFELNIQCFKCHHNSEFTFDILKREDSD